MEDGLSAIVRDFDSNRMAAGKAMRLLLDSSVDTFKHAALPLLRNDNNSPGMLYLLSLILNEGLILDLLADPSLFSLDEALAITRRLLRIDPLFDIKMVRSIGETDAHGPRGDLEKQTACARDIRLLELVAALSEGPRILPAITHLLYHSDARVRSKAALMVGRSNKNHRWAEQKLSEADPRVRANAVESQWGEDSQGTRALFWGALADPDNRVAGNATLGLYQLGDPASISLILALCNHPSPEFRVTANWIMGETGDPRFLGVLARALADTNAKIRTTAFRSVAKLKQSAVKFATGAPIDIHVLQCERSAPSASLTIAVWSAAEKSSAIRELVGLKPTQFVLEQSGQLIEDYDIRETSHPEAISVSFALPRLLDAGGSAQNCYGQAFSQALRHKRKSDAWRVAKFLESDRDTPFDRRTQTNQLSILGLSSRFAPHQNTAATSGDEITHFSCDPATILAAVETAGPRSEMPKSLLEAARALLPLTAHSRGARNLVLLVDSPTPDESAWADFTLQARKHKIAVHSMTLKPAPALAELCAKTGGVYWPLTTVSEIPGALESLCAGMVNQFQIRYTQRSFDTALPPPELKIKVYSQNNFGECSCPCTLESNAVTAVAKAG